MRTPPKKQNGQGKGHRTINGCAFDVRGAALFLGCTEKTLRCQIDRRTIPHRKLNGRVILLRAELEAWLRNLPGVTLEQAQDNQLARQG